MNDEEFLRLTTLYLEAAIEAGDSAISPEARQFVNRASDLVFVAARAANNNGKSDILWQPGLNR